jgi:excisionase family DNA binding protein
MGEMKPVFIRLPEAQVRRLEQACGTRGMTKQAFVSQAVISRLDGETGPGVGRAIGVGPDEVLTLDELAELLKIDPGALRRRVEKGQVPGRRFGAEWRFSRSGILSWLSEPEPSGRRTTGFDAGA